MKKAILAIAAATTLALFASGASADPQVVGDNADSVQIKRSAYKLAPAEFDDYAYLFVLDGGSKIKFTRSVNHYFAEVPGAARIEMVPQAPGVFRTAAGTRIEFREGGEVVAIDQLERLLMAQNMPATGVTILARR